MKINTGVVTKNYEVITMTKKQVLQKAEAMLNDDKKFMLFRIEELLECGGIDKNVYQNDFRLPKILLYAALENLKTQRRPLSKDDYLAACNLRHYA